MKSGVFASSTVNSHLGPYLLGPDGPSAGIYQGDARVLSKAIPNNSVDLILTDPLYDQMDDYRWLAKTAVRVLKPNRACLTFCGIGFLPETLEALIAGGLHYRWYIPHLTPGTGGYCDTGPSRHMAMLWFDNSGTTTPSPRLYDVVFTTGVQDWHKWRKNITGVMRWLNSFRGIVVDPFCGGGTTPAGCKMLGLPWLAFELQGDVAEIARERVRQTQPPLLGLVAKQVGFGDDLR